MQPAIKYRAPWWLPGGNLQTIWAALGARRYADMAPVFRRERWATPDGDFVDVDQLHCAPMLPALRGSLPPEGALRLRSGKASPAAPAGKDVAPTIPEGAVLAWGCAALRTASLAMPTILATAVCCSPSAHGTLISGVLKLVGRLLSSTPASGTLLTISSRRQPA